MKKSSGEHGFSWLVLSVFVYFTLSLLLTDYLWRIINTPVETLLTYVILGNIAVIFLTVIIGIKVVRR